MLGRWTTLNDFFHLTDRPYETLRPEPDQYQTPYLTQAVSKRDPEPVSRLVRHHKLRAQYDAARAIEALARAVSLSSSLEVKDLGTVALGPAFEEVESLIETARHDEAATALELLENSWSQALAGCILCNQRSDGTVARENQRPGYLVLNPSSVPRHAAVVLPDAAADLRPKVP